MQKDADDKRDPYDFDSSGQVMNWLSLPESVVLAMRLARADPTRPRWFNRWLKGKRMVFNVEESHENDDFYYVTLTFRPEGNFEGTPGREQFILQKNGEVNYRGVLGYPRRAGDRGIPVKLTIAGLGVITFAAVTYAVVVGLTSNRGNPGGEDRPFSTIPPTKFRTETTRIPVPTKTPIPTSTPLPTVKPTAQRKPNMVATRAPSAAPDHLLPVVTTPVLNHPNNATVEPTMTIISPPSVTQALPPEAKLRITTVSFTGTGYTLYIDVGFIPGAGSQVSRSVRTITTGDVATVYETTFTKNASGRYSGAIIVDRERILNPDIEWVRENIAVEILLGTG